MVYFGNKEKNAVTLPHIAQRKHACLGEIKQMSKSKKIAPKKKFALELLHHRLWHRSAISLMDGYNANVWKDIELRIYPYPFCISCQIYAMNKKARSKNPLNTKALFKWVYGYYSSNRTKCFTGETTFSNYLLIVGAY